MVKVIRISNPNAQANKPEPLATPQRTSLVSRMLDVIADDIKSLVFRKDLMLGKEPDGWEDYKKFCELAKGKR